MTRQRITITTSDRIVVLRGWRLRELLLAGGFRAPFSASAGGHMLDADRLPDLLAYLESRHVGYVTTDAQDRSPGGGAA